METIGYYEISRVSSVWDYLVSYYMKTNTFSPWQIIATNSCQGEYFVSFICHWKPILNENNFAWKTFYQYPVSNNVLRYRSVEFILKIRSDKTNFKVWK